MKTIWETTDKPDPTNEVDATHNMCVSATRDGKIEIRVSSMFPGTCEISLEKTLTEEEVSEMVAALALWWRS